ncbi:hypothetical protein QBC47DRAFT_393943 [Echria macrotheca]|uniref:Enoyl reductase (ER) domain-containing protein n=1 Tax=Echria macrotheca TaxID=438768 RepID=A0AAJ0B368_9PEZI|nr:hypothetical protein QBC47DRAFT_393943 [Echria macrotheca]
MKLHIGAPRILAFSIRTTSIASRVSRRTSPSPHDPKTRFTRHFTTMKAVQILGERGKHQLALSDSLPRPTPAGKELLIKVHAAGITADEVSWVEVYKTPSRIPGHDISGTIAQLGPDYSGPFTVGDAVFAMLHADRGQGMAEYALASAEEVAPKPKTISHAQAAALPIPVVTAWEALFRHAELKSRARILVTGASGAVGQMLVQIAKHVVDAEVVALGSVQKHELLRELGAAEVVDYNVENWDETIKEVDAVFDTAGGLVLSKSWKVVKGDGVIVTVADPPPAWAFTKELPTELSSKPGVKYIYFVLEPDSAALEKVGDLIDRGAVKTLPVVEYPVSEALEAWKAAGQRSRKGKVVINFV